MYITKYLCHASLSQKPIIEHSYVTCNYHCTTGVFLDTLSQIVTACLELVLIIDSHKISKILCHESNTQKAVSALGIIQLENDFFSF